jgi:Tol biopolymer transport system component
VRPDGKQLQKLTHNLRSVSYLACIDNDTVLFLARDADGSGPWIWQYDVRTEKPRRARRGIQSFASLSVSRDGKRLVATALAPEVSLFQVPILTDRVATEEDVKPFPLQAARALGPRFSGDALYFLSSRGGGDGLLRAPAAISPDGQRVALLALEGTTRRLTVCNADGTGVRQLADEVDALGEASWSPNGEWIALSGIRDGKAGTFKVNADSGRTELLHDGESLNPIWSPDGTMIVFEDRHVRLSAALTAVTPDGQAIDRFPEAKVRPFGHRARFLPNGKGIVYVMGANPFLEFYLLDLESGETRQLTDLRDTVLWSFDILPDGSGIVFDRRENNSDIVLIERE